jgi:hypothetical protein
MVVYGILYAHFSAISIDSRKEDADDKLRQWHLLKAGVAREAAVEHRRI